MQRTISLSIRKYPELLKTIKLYNQIVNEHIAKSFELKTNSKSKLHKALYKQIRERHPYFPSALIQCARDNAVEMLKGNKYKRKTTKRLDSSIRFDLRTTKVLLKSGELQLTTVKKRKKYPIKIPDYFAKYIDWKVKGVTLGIDKKALKLKVIVEGEQPILSKNKSVLGIDLGIKTFAVLSNGTFIRSNKINGIKRRYTHLRKRLQSKGTQSAKRRLRLFNGRERRFMTDYNHCLSKQISRMDYGVFALEDLKGIRKGRKGKVFNRRRSSWAFYQFRQFLTYKVENIGKQVLAIDPRYTSQRCSKCGFVAKANRKKGVFHCLSCGFYCSSDLNASFNISSIGVSLLKQAVVNQPIVTVDEGVCSLQNTSARHQSQANML